MSQLATRRNHGHVDQGDRLTVLVADAHERYRSGLVRAIAMHPGLVVTAVADHGLVALSLILSERPDIALLDVRLAGLDGFTLSERLMTERITRTRVILLAAVPDRAQTNRAKSAGALAVLGKDISRWDICKALLAAVPFPRRATQSEAFDR